MTAVAVATALIESLIRDSNKELPKQVLLEFLLQYQEQDKLPR